MENKEIIVDRLKTISQKTGIDVKPRCQLVKQEGGDVLYLEGGVYPDSWAWEDEEHISAKKVREQLNGVGDVLIHLNSPGGSVFEGLQIYNILKDHPGNVTVQIDGLAASIATVICMGADKVQARNPAVFMIHHAFMGMIGNAAELRKGADDLEQIDKASCSAYMGKFNGTPEELNRMLDEETYLTAEDAYTLGFIDELITEEAQPTPEEPQPTEEPVAGLFTKFKASAPTDVFLFKNFRGK